MFPMYVPQFRYITQIVRIIDYRIYTQGSAIYLQLAHDSGDHIASEQAVQPFKAVKMAAR